MYTSSTTYLFRPRFPFFSLIFGALLLSKGWVFLGSLLLAFAVTRILRWRRGGVEAPAAFRVFVRRGAAYYGNGSGARGGHSRAQERLRPFESGAGIDESRVAAAEWRESRVEN